MKYFAEVVLLEHKIQEERNALAREWCKENHIENVDDDTLASVYVMLLTKARVRGEHV